MDFGCSLHTDHGLGTHMFRVKDVKMIYPLVICYIANWKITMFYGKIHQKNGHFPVRYVHLPGGTHFKVPSDAKWHPQDAFSQRREVWCASCLGALAGMSPIKTIWV